MIGNRKNKKTLPKQEYATVPIPFEDKDAIQRVADRIAAQITDLDLQSYLTKLLAVSIGLDDIKRLEHLQVVVTQSTDPSSSPQAHYDKENGILYIQVVRGRDGRDAIQYPPLAVELAYSPETGDLIYTNVAFDEDAIGNFQYDVDNLRDYVLSIAQAYIAANIQTTINNTINGRALATQTQLNTTKNEILSIIDGVKDDLALSFADKYALIETALTVIRDTAESMRDEYTTELTALDNYFDEILNELIRVRDKVFGEVVYDLANLNAYKIDKVLSAKVGDLPVFKADGGLDTSGWNIYDLIAKIEGIVSAAVTLVTNIYNEVTNIFNDMQELYNNINQIINDIVIEIYEYIDEELKKKADKFWIEEDLNGDTYLVTEVSGVGKYIIDNHPDTFGGKIFVNSREFTGWIDVDDGTFFWATHSTPGDVTWITDKFGLNVVNPATGQTLLNKAFVSDFDEVQLTPDINGEYEGKLVYRNNPDIEIHFNKILRYYEIITLIYGVAIKNPQTYGLDNPNEQPLLISQVLHESVERPDNGVYILDNNLYGDFTVINGSKAEYQKIFETLKIYLYNMDGSVYKIVDKNTPSTPDEYIEYIINDGELYFVFYSNDYVVTIYIYGTDMTEIWYQVDTATPSSYNPPILVTSQYKIVPAPDPYIFRKKISNSGPKTFSISDTQQTTQIDLSVDDVSFGVLGVSYRANNKVFISLYLNYETEIVISGQYTNNAGDIYIERDDRYILELATNGRNLTKELITNSNNPDQWDINLRIFVSHTNMFYSLKVVCYTNGANKSLAISLQEFTKQ
jgi:hypothetical protein